MKLQIQSDRPQQSYGVGITGPVKMIVWDLDNSFWGGTLAEEGITPIPAHVELVKTLANRGIVSSICSKNELAAVRTELERLGIWDYFVFPRIQLAPKGPAVKQILESAKLRAENALFIDDSIANLEDASFHCPGLMCLLSPDDLLSCVESKFLQGTSDPALQRLGQYKLLETRSEAQATYGQSNLDFLRQSGIEVEIRYDVENYLDRIVELVNRSNQLNFTKSRITTDDNRRAFENKLNGFGFKSGVVHVRDRYGDYGMVGFFMTLANHRTYQCDHFVFSCRIMNMGIEQYIYDYLNRPKITVRPPVANELRPYASVDWISNVTGSQDLRALRKQKVLAIGGCDMLQIATYCADNSAEFTNRSDGELMVRYDDPYFFLSSPEAVEASRLRPQIPVWTADDIRQFEAQLATSDIVVLSFAPMMTETYFQGKDRLIVRFHPETIRNILKSEKAIWFVQNFSYMPLTRDEKRDLLRQSVLSIVRRAKPGTQLFILSENLQKIEHLRQVYEFRSSYNEYLRMLSSTIPTLEYLDVNEVVASECVIDGWHMSRQGYFAIANEITKRLENH